MFDRETRREKIIEAKQREQKLKTKSSAKADATTTKDKQAQLAEAEARMVREAGKEFEELVEKLVSGRTPGSVSPKSAFRPSGQDGVKLYFKNERSKFFLEINERRPPPPPVKVGRFVYVDKRSYTGFLCRSTCVCRRIFYTVWSRQ